MDRIEMIELENNAISINPDEIETIYKVNDFVTTIVLKNNKKRILVALPLADVTAVMNGKPRRKKDISKWEDIELFEIEDLPINIYKQIKSMGHKTLKDVLENRRAIKSMLNTNNDRFIFAGWVNTYIYGNEV